MKIITDEEHPIYGWHASTDLYLAYGDRRLIKVGELLGVTPPVVPCKWGLHVAPTPLRALSYKGNLFIYLWAVIGFGECSYENGKWVCENRRAVGRLAPNQIRDLFKEIWGTLEDYTVYTPVPLPCKELFTSCAERPIPWRQLQRYLHSLPLFAFLNLECRFARIALESMGTLDHCDSSSEWLKCQYQDLGMIVSSTSSDWEKAP